MFEENESWAHVAVVRKVDAFDDFEKRKRQNES